jgi:hypothetical protein
MEFLSTDKMSKGLSRIKGGTDDTNPQTPSVSSSAVLP